MKKKIVCTGIALAFASAAAMAAAPLLPASPPASLSGPAAVPNIPQNAAVQPGVPALPVPAQQASVRPPTAPHAAPVATCRAAPAAASAMCAPHPVKKVVRRRRPAPVAATPSAPPATSAASTVASAATLKPALSPAEEAARLSQRWENNPKAMPSMGNEGKVVFVYGQSAPTVLCAPLRVCDIELEPGETVMGEPHAGDPVRWDVEPAIVGTGDKKTVHLIIKLKSDEIGLNTNLMIPTDRRAYYINLVSAATQFSTHVAFYYPDSQAKAWEAQRAAMAKESAPVVSEMPALSIDNLRFNYAVTVDKGSPHFAPTRVFDDGEKTYFQMPLSMKVDEAPAFVLIGTDGKEQLVNYRVRNGYYVIDRIFTKAALIAGVGNEQDRVIVTRDTCKQRNWLGNCVVSE